MRLSFDWKNIEFGFWAYSWTVNIPKLKDEIAPVTTSTIFNPLFTQLLTRALASSEYVLIRLGEKLDQDILNLNCLTLGGPEQILLDLKAI